MQQGGDITVPGRKLLDIFRALAEKTSVTLSTEGERVSIRVWPQPLHAFEFAGGGISAGGGNQRAADSHRGAGRVPAR